MQTVLLVIALSSAPGLLERQRNLTTAKDALVTLQYTTARALREGNQIEADAAKLPELVTQWVQSWEELRAKLAADAPAGGQPFATEFQDLLRKTSDKTQAVAAASGTLSRELTDVLAGLRNQPRPTGDDFGALGGRLDVATEALTTLQSRLDYLAASAKTVQASVAPYAEAKVKAAVARAGLADANRIIAEVSAYLRAEALLDPMLKEVRSGYGTYSRAYTALRLFHALDAAKELATLADTTSARVATLQIPAGLKDEALAVVASYRDRAATQLAQLQQQFSKQAIVRRFAEKRVQLLKVRCRANDPALDCTTFATLAAIPGEKIEAMDEAWLRYFEFAWNRVEARRDA